MERYNALIGEDLFLGVAEGIIIVVNNTTTLMKIIFDL